MKKIVVAVLVLVALGAIVLAVAWWRLRSEPDELAAAPPITPAQVDEVLRTIDVPAEPPAPPIVAPSVAQPAPAPRPYRVALADRQLAALVQRQLASQLPGTFSDVRVSVRAGDLVAGARLAATPLAGAVLSLTAVPSVGQGGRLCLSLRAPHLGGQAVPEDLIEQLGGGPGQRLPRFVCSPARALGLPGPVRSVAIAAGRVMVEGVRD